MTHNPIRILLLLLLFGGCINENPSLVNPPLVVETVNVRFFNLAADGGERTLLFDTKVIAGRLPFNSISSPDSPPFDSVTVEILNGRDSLTYRQQHKLKFGRLSNYIILALPNLARRQASDTGFVNTDTMVYLQSTTLKPPDTNQCFVKFLNANPDTSSTYSIKIGCPNGDNLFIDNEITNVSYLQSTGTQTVYEGQRVISIIKNSRLKTPESSSSSSQVIGIFELTLSHLQQYALIVNHLDEVYFFDELEYQRPPLVLQPVNARTANVRLVNLSSGEVSFESSQAGILGSNLSPDWLSSYNTITTCDIMTLDRLYLQSGGINTDTAFMSFDIYKNYTLLAFDTSSAAGSEQLIAVPPVDDRTVAAPGSALVRIVNLNYSLSRLTVSCGAGSFAGESGYMSGVTLCSGLAVGEYSEAVSLPLGADGAASLAVFRSTQPSVYLFSGCTFLEPGKEYLITIDALSGGKLGVIEVMQADMAVDFALPSSYTQVANMTGSTLPFSLSGVNFGELISDGRLPSGGLVATFLPSGGCNLTLGGTAFNFDISNLSFRNLLVACGGAASPEIFALSGASLGAGGDSFKYRFINAAADCPVLDVYQIERADTLAVNLGINYKSGSAILSYHRDKSYSFVFRDQATGSILYTANDLLFTLSKNYSVILAGSQASGYRILVLQEY